MAEIDPVIVQLRADLAKYRADMVSTANRVDTALAGQQRSVQRLETQIRSSSSAIATAFASVGAAFAGAFSAQAFANLADSYTRLQNSLKVAGLEGQALADVQQRLLELSGRNGVSIEELGRVYGGAAQSANELGISSGGLLAITQAVAESLRVTGTSATQAQGAMLGLTQALGSGRVKAEEFNQINEGGLRPLLQAAANAERFGGSVARLRSEIVAGTVSSQEFYQGILANASGISERAAKANLTVANSMEALRSQFVVFIGQADQSLGVTAALTNGLRLLGENIDVVAQALAVIAVIMGGRLVVAAGAATASFVATRTAAIGLAVSLNGVAASSAVAGRALLAAFGGPVGVAILAVGGALAYASSEAFQLRGVTEETRRVQSQAAAGATALEGAINRLATSYGAARDEALSLIRAQRQVATFNLGQANARSLVALGNINAANRQLETGGMGGGPIGGRGASAVREARAGFEDDFNAAGAAALEALETIRRADAALSGATARAPAGAGAGGGGAAASRGGRGGARASGGASGPSPEEIQARFANELTSLAQQTLSARRQLATTAEEEAEFQLRSVELARRQTLEQIEAERDYSDAQKQRLADQVEALAAAEIAAIERDRANRLEQEANDLREAELRGLTDALRARLDLADNAAARQQLALEIFDLEEQERQAILARTAANQALDSAIRQRATAELAAAQASQGQRRDAVGQGNETPAQRFMREINRSSAAINEDLDAIAIDGLNNLNDGITDAIMNAEGLGDVFKKVANQIIADLIRIAVQQAIIQPIANSLFGGSGGFGSIFGGLFGRASGGYVAPGQMVRVNEGASRGRVEGFMPTGSGKIVPLGQMNAISGGGGGSGGVVQVQVTLSEDLNARIDNRATNVAVNVTRQTAPTIIGAARDATINEIGRVRM